MCEEPKGARLVAVKVIRRIRKYVESGRVEAEILEDVSQCDPHGVSNCVRLLHSFDWRSHYCMVFEPLGKSLYDYVKANRHRPLPLYCVQHMADQLVSALGFLHQMRLVHTDLKLENVLLVNREPLHVTDKPTMYREQLGARVLAPVSTTIRLIDFGGASYDDSRVANTGTINTRQYRSPEVILGMPWGIASDVWSMGCILMELYTGELLFPTHDNAEHLALMEATLGAFPLPFLRENVTEEVRRYFESSGRSRFPALAREKDSVRKVKSARRLRDRVHEKDEVFLDLVERMLRVDPRARMSASQSGEEQAAVSFPLRQEVTGAGAGAPGKAATCAALGRQKPSSRCRT